jgi:RNA polymerase sigma factor (sigma-70 family)
MRIDDDMARPAPPPFGIEDLLAHADGLRRLAVQLVRGRDPGLGEDAVQETWAAALRAPPGRERPAEPWLAEVLRNFVRRALRGERSRRAREARVVADAAVADAAEAPSPELLLERADAQRRLVELVVALEEPFRSTVLLRYFEGLNAAEIARRQDVPAGTVRWRLKQGLDRLRAALDAREAGAERRWLALLAPLAGAGAGTAPWRVPSLQGGVVLAMQKKTVAAVAILVLGLLVGGVAWRLRSPAPAQTPVTAAARPPAAPGPAERRPLRLPSGVISRDGSRAGSVDGAVVSAVDGAGIAGAEVTFSFGDTSQSLRTDGAGQFHFAPADAGGYLLARAAAEGFVAFAPEWGDSPISFTLRPGERIGGVTLALRPSCQGVVVDEGGQPVAGARVSMWNLGRVRQGANSLIESDGQGRFQFAPAESAYVAARHGRRFARQPLPPVLGGRCEIRLRLGGPRELPEASISGAVEGPDGRPVAGVTVEAVTNPALEPGAFHAFARATSDDGGRFALAPLDPIAYTVSAFQGAREVALVHDVRGGSRDVVLRLPSLGRLRGVVRDGSSGAPVTSFAVIVSTPRGPLDNLSVGTFSRYDARGVFELDGLPAGRQRVVVVARGLAPSEPQDVVIAPEPAPPPELTFTLRGGSRVFGTIVDRQSRAPLAGARVSVQGAAGVGISVPLDSEALSGADGRFELRGLAPGRAAVLANADGHHGRMVGGLEVKAGADLGPLEIALGPTAPGEPPRLELIGIGAVLTPKDGAILIGSVMPGGSAALSGLVAGDAILAVDGYPVAELGMGGAVGRIRGAEGTVVVLRVRRAADGGQSDVYVTRRPVPMPPRETPPSPAR